MLKSFLAALLLSALVKRFGVSRMLDFYVKFSKYRPSGPMLSVSLFVHMEGNLQTEQQPNPCHKICNLLRFMLDDCDYAESYGRFLSGGKANASHAVYLVPDDS